VKLTEQEVRERKLSEAHHAEARRALEVIGYVVFEDVLPAEKVAALHGTFIELLERNMREVGDNRGRQRQGGVPLPIEEPFSDPDVLGNPLAIELLADILDGDITCSYFASDTALPGSDYQPAHRDGKPLFPGSDFTVPPYMYEVNIPLVDFRPDNGPVEIWPHTHRVHDFPLASANALQLPAAEQRSTEVQQFAAELGPQPVLMPAGSLLLRDPRMWHRGSPNRSDAPRPMLAIAYGRPWYRFNSVRVSRAVYNAWPEPLQKIFRLASIDGDLSTEFA
jgi:ectoine hydroxylase-related dioxygenase (phytanoyl-CoA dioxygenase family)